MRKHYVTFLSPGTLFNEETTREVPESFDARDAVKMASEITERHGAKPYGFYLSTRITHEPVPDGEGGTLEVQSKELSRSGTFFIGGVLHTLDDLEARRDSSLRILISNMKANDWPIVVENNNSWKVTQPFREEDVILTQEGSVAWAGNDIDFKAYRRRKIEERRAELGVA